MAWHSRWARTRAGRLVVLVVGAVAFLGLLWALLFPVSTYFAGKELRSLKGKDRADVLNGTRQNVITSAGLLVAGFTVSGYFLTRRRQQTDRYSAAAARLSSAQLIDRVLGLHELASLLHESPLDHVAIVDLICGFVRDRARSAVSLGVPPDADVALALKVLTTRPRAAERQRLDLRGARLAGLELQPSADLGRADLTGADLTGTNLGWARLRGARLDRADLTDAVLDGADLREASLRYTVLIRARLYRADLTGAVVCRADLTGATLSQSLLTGAFLVESDLRDAHLTQAVMDGTVLSESDLRYAENLTRAQALAALPRSTRLPRRLIDDPEVREHMETCASPVVPDSGT